MIFHEYIKGDIKLNKKSYKSTILTIFLAVVILSTFVFGVTSYYKSYRDIIENQTGGYHFRIVDGISNKDANNLKENRHIKKVGFFNSEMLDEGFGSKEKTMFMKIDDISLSTIKSWLKEGSLPKVNEVIISNDMAREIDKKIGDNITIKGKSHRISGIFYDITYEFHECYNIFLNVPQEELLKNEKELCPFIWYKNIFKTYKLSKEIMENFETENVTYNYNMLYLDRSFVFDPEDDFLKDHMFQMIVIILFIILILLFYFIITNLFLVQETKSIKEYSKLKAIGATTKDINKIIKIKALYLSQIPIILGIICSIGIVNVLFLVLNKVEIYFKQSNNIMENIINLNYNSNFKYIIFIYILSIVIIYLSTKKPIKKLKNNSILDGLKGNIRFKSYKKYDLIYKGNIEKDLSKQFYDNNKRSFIFSNLTLKIGFLLMSFIMIVISYIMMEEENKNYQKYSNYNIQAKYATIETLDKNMLKDIKSVDYDDIDDFINFRREYVFWDYNKNYIDDEYVNSGSLDNLKDEVYSFDSIKLNIIGVDDEVFNNLVSKKGFDVESFKGNKVLLFNTLGHQFNLPTSKIIDKKFFKDDIKKISLSEYGNVLSSRGYEFELNIEDKIYEPLFDYPLPKNKLNCYMPKSEYIKLMESFERLADIDQFEYIILKSKNIEKDQKLIENISENYFKEGDFGVESKINLENLWKKRMMKGNVVALFFSLFFVIVGFSNCYFVFYNLFLERKNDLILYNMIGMDKELLKGIFKREKNKILINFIGSMPILLLLMTFILSKTSKIFTAIDLLKKLNYIYILGYIVLIYITISKMYNKYVDEII